MSDVIEQRSMTAADIQAALRQLGGFYGVFVPEFTYNGSRIDAAIVDISKRWIRGFEIKVSRSDFLRDEKWQMYSEFCSSLSIACPEGLIRKDEVPDPFGLLYVLNEPRLSSDLRDIRMRWEKKPRRFQRRNSLAWLYQYVKVIEKELPRMNLEIQKLAKAIRLERNRA